MIDTKSLREYAPIREPVWLECLDEIDRLSAALKTSAREVERVVAERDALGAKIERLRAALEDIRRGKMPEDGGSYECMAARLVGIAGRALEGR